MQKKEVKVRARHHEVTMCDPSSRRWKTLFTYSIPSAIAPPRRSR